MSSDRLILGCAYGFKSDNLTSFLRSLEILGYAGALHVYVDRKSDIDADALPLKVQLEQPMPSPWSKWRTSYKLNQLFPKIGAQFLIDWVTDRLTMFCVRRRWRIPNFLLWNYYAHHYFMTSRFFLYYNQIVSSDCKQVMLSDLSDVLFFKNPFDLGFNQGVHAFAENESIPLGQQAINANWIAKGFGKEVLDQMSGETIYCAGTIIGERHAMLQFLEEFMRTVIEKKISKTMKGIDQGVFNYLVSYKKLPFVHKHRNGEGILTMGILPPGAFELKDDGVHYQGGREAMPILHQYNRHPELTAELTARFGGSVPVKAAP